MAARERRRAAAPPEVPLAAASVVVYHHDECLLHVTSNPATGEAHQEGPDRVSAILDALRSVPGVAFVREFAPADDAILEQVHARDYLRRLAALDAELRAADPADPPTPRRASAGYAAPARARARARRGRRAQRRARADGERDALLARQPRGRDARGGRRDRRGRRRARAPPGPRSASCGLRATTRPPRASTAWRAAAGSACSTARPPAPRARVRAASRASRSSTLTCTTATARSRSCASASTARGRRRRRRGRGRGRRRRLRRRST